MDSSWVIPSDGRLKRYVDVAIDLYHVDSLLLLHVVSLKATIAPEFVDVAVMTYAHLLGPELYVLDTFMTAT